MKNGSPNKRFIEEELDGCDQLSIEQTVCSKREQGTKSQRMSRPALEKTALRLLKSRMEQKNGVQQTLMANGIMFKIDEQQAGLPEIISEETFVELARA